MQNQLQSVDPFRVFLGCLVELNPREMNRLLVIGIYHTCSEQWVNVSKRSGTYNKGIIFKVGFIANINKDQKKTQRGPEEEDLVL